MTKFAINIMGYWEDKESNYNANTVEELFETWMNQKCEIMRCTGVSVKQLPDHHIVIEKNSVKRRTSKLGMALDKNK